MENHQIFKKTINQSVCRWCFDELSLEELCKLSLEIGLVGIDLLGPADWPILQKYGLKSTMCNGAEISLEQGWNDKIYHSTLIDNYKSMIPLVGIDDETGMQNCVEGLKEIMLQAEKNKVTIVMELLNSKIDHLDYQCDRTHWGVELVKRVGSENFKLLYDIYHMQIDEGDVIRTIKQNYQYIAHYHTAGVPGRHEIDHSQELNYPAIMRAILDTGFDGYVAQEFIPSRPDRADSLREAFRICNV